ncbi:hypothetical protein V1504DRAFT_165906 [Lipomyces starkeyi]
MNTLIVRTASRKASLLVMKGFEIIVILAVIMLQAEWTCRISLKVSNAAAVVAVVACAASSGSGSVCAVFVIVGMLSGINISVQGSSGTMVQELKAEWTWRISLKVSDAAAVVAVGACAASSGSGSVCAVSVIVAMLSGINISVQGSSGTMVQELKEG